MKPLKCVFLAWIATLTTASAQPYIINTVAGHGKLAYPGDGKPAIFVNLFSPNRVAFDRAGNLYFTESYYNRAFKLSAAGTLTVVAGDGRDVFAGEGGPATAASIPSPEGIAVDTAGNLYLGSASRLCKISGGQLHTIAGNGDDGYSGDRGPATSAQIHSPAGIAVDGSGNVFFSERESSVVRRIGADGIITTVAGTGTPGYSGDTLPATSAQFNTPEGLAFDSAGNLYIADRFNHRVRKLAPSGIVTTFAGTGVAGDGGSGFAVGAKLFQPEGVAVDATDRVFIADTSNGLLKMVDPAGTINTFSPHITSLNDVAVNPVDGWIAAPDFVRHIVNRIDWEGGKVSVVAGIVRSTALGDQGAAVEAYFVDPWGLVFDPSGNLFVADNGDHRLRKVSLDGMINTVAGTGVFGASADGQLATSSNIAQPRALATDTAGNIYFNSACQIRVLLRNGNLNTVAGGSTCGYRGDPSAALDALLQFPRGLATDSSGMLYIADTDNNRIRRVNLATGIIATIAGSGERGYAGNGTSALQAKMDYPLGLVADSKGNVYFADQNNHRVRKITPAGIISDFAGSGICDDPSDGPATSSPLCYPTAVALDASGNLYIADSGHIRRVAADGRLTTIAGNGYLTMSNDGDLATATGIAPFYLALDSKGRACFSDWSNLRIRCLDAAPAPPAATVTVVNAATFLTGPVAPGEIVTVYGAGMGPATLVTAPLDASGPPLATTLSGAQITFDGVAAPLLYVSATQSSGIVPFAVAGKTSTKIEVTYQSKSAGSATLSVSAASPGLFTMASSGSGQGAILNQDWSVNSAARPAARGDILMLFGTGGGVTTPASGDGEFSTGTPANLAVPPTVTIGGVNARVWYAGAAPGMVAGVFQINVEVPGAAPTGIGVPIVVTSRGVSSPSGVTVALSGTQQ